MRASFRGFFYYVKDNVIKSELSTIIDFSDVDWNAINIKILNNNNIKEALKLKKEGYTHKEVANILDISESAVTRLVQHGVEIGELEPFSRQHTNVYSKVMVVVNLNTLKKKYYIGLKKFYNNSVDYLGFKISDAIFKSNQKNGHLVINGYDMYKITYGEYMRETLTN